MAALEFADFGVIGEGEETMCELAHYLEQGKYDYHNVKGIIYFLNNEFVKTQARPDIENIDLIPWPDYQGFDIDKYITLPPPNFAGMSSQRMICMIGSRSCPYKCTFCFHTNGKKYRRRSFDRLFEEIDYLLSRYNFDYIVFLDELFCPKASDAEEFCRRMKKYNMHWHASFRIDRLTPESIKMYKDSGVEVMCFGLESADNRILESMAKKTTIEVMERNLSMVYDAGISTGGTFIFGDVEETYETAKNTLEWWSANRKYKIDMTLIKPYPGSFIYEQACSVGLIKDRVKYLKDGCPQINISKMNDDEFSEICLEIADAQHSLGGLESVQLISYNQSLGRQTILGTCLRCRQENTWADVKLFSFDYIACSKCGQKYSMPCPDVIFENIERNVTFLCKIYNKVAIWGITQQIMMLFKRSATIQGSDVFPIDISESKQGLTLYGKTVRSPDVIDIENIRVVLIGAPALGSQISSMVRERFPNVIEIIDISVIGGSSAEASTWTDLSMAQVRGHSAHGVSQTV